MHSHTDGLPIFTALSLGIFFLLIASIFFRRRSRSLYDSISGPKRSSIFGYLLDLHNPDGLDWHFAMTKTYGHVAKLSGGLIRRDALYITDPAALHSILVRDQDIFRESTEFAGLFGIIHRGDGVASVHGAEHKKQRRFMDPIFTSSQISKLTPLFYNVTRQLQAALTNEILETPGVHIDILDHLTRTSLEIIAQGALGHTFNSFGGGEEYVQFLNAITSVLPLASDLYLVLPYLNSLRKLQPVWLRRAFTRLVPYLPWPSLRKFKAAVESMHPIYATILNNKKATYEQGGIEALEEESSTGSKDLMTVLFKSNWQASEEERLPDDVIRANMSAVIHGGQETTSSLLSRFISVMTLDPLLQNRVRDEIKAATERNNGDDLDFYELTNLPFLDAVCKETLRLFTPVTFVPRKAIRDIIVPLQFPLRDSQTGAERRELLISKGTPVYLGLAAANRSTAIWGPDASEFKPERWLNTDTPVGHSDSQKLPGVYSNMMTFLGGERSCPGYRFALFEIKLVLSVLLRSFSFEKTLETVDWRLGITLVPFVRGQEDAGPKVPVKVTILD